MLANPSLTLTLDLYKYLDCLLIQIMETSLNLVPEVYRDIYKKKWNTITGEKRGLIKDIFHFPILEETDDEIAKHLKDVVNSYEHAKIKLNVAFGFILQEGVYGELRFFHPSNNTTVFELPKVIQNAQDLEKLLGDVEYVDALEYAKEHRPSTKWRVAKIVCVRIDIFKF